MKRNVFIPILLLLLAGTGFYCQPGKIESPTLTGKLVIDGPCSNYVIQVLSGNIDSSKIVASWKDSTFGHDTTYTNVFTVSDFCTFGNNHLSQGDVFTFRITDSVPVQTCMQCLIYVPTPQKRNAVIDVQKIQSK
ncbi:hypothetical protein [Puia dinghuensis]|uniref:Lipoprotein n=1 Tax=Puia dinghuensis TaxID=1792502 RepID=A0A8J2XTK9_9BACT|nr:hypothetical protein [Puia dinghuensis]GGB04378.1 hypothetical protein GCM10011511_29610 [Puia dinghuensis]